jgi:hypothetical protein
VTSISAFRSFAVRASPVRAFRTFTCDPDTTISFSMEANSMFRDTPWYASAASGRADPEASVK